MKNIATASILMLLLCGSLSAQTTGGRNEAVVKSALNANVSGGGDNPTAAIPADSSAAPDLTTQPTLYVVGYAHLDTEWRWEYPQVIDEYIRKTMEDNFKLSSKNIPTISSTSAAPTATGS